MTRRSKLRALRILSCGRSISSAILCQEKRLLGEQYHTFSSGAHLSLLPCLFFILSKAAPALESRDPEGCINRYYCGSWEGRAAFVSTYNKRKKTSIQIGTLLSFLGREKKISQLRSVQHVTNGCCFSLFSIHVMILLLHKWSVRQVVIVA